MKLTKKEKETIVKSLNQYQNKMLWKNHSKELGITALGFVVKTIPYIETQRTEKEREWIKDLIKKIKTFEETKCNMN